MEDFHAGGGCRRCGGGCGHLDLSARTVSGETLGEVIARWPAYVDDKVIRPLDKPVVRERGHRDPQRHPRAAGRRHQARRRDQGAVPARGAGARLRLARRPRAAHRRSRARRHAAHRHGAAQCRADRRARHAGGRRAADPEEARQPRHQGHGAHFRRAHERHRLRHRGAACQPEAAAGGPLALVRDGDIIRLDPPRAASTSRSRRPSSRAAARGGRPPPKPARGYARLYVERVTQADRGCDFDFLAGER